MSYPAKKERNHEIVVKRDKEKWPWQKIADHFNLKSHGNVRKIYYRELSTRGQKQGIVREQAG